jgi:hypothetical protein
MYIAVREPWDRVACLYFPPPRADMARLSFWLGSSEHVVLVLVFEVRAETDMLRVFPSFESRRSSRYDISWLLFQCTKHRKILWVSGVGERSDMEQIVCRFWFHGELSKHRTYQGYMCILRVGAKTNMYWLYEIFLTLLATKGTTILNADFNAEHVPSRGLGIWGQRRRKHEVLDLGIWIMCYIESPNIAVPHLR